MEQYNMRANYFPLNESINGLVGHANLTISNTLWIQGISVFENKEGPGYHFQFPGFGQGEDFVSYVVPNSPEAYAQLKDVIQKAIDDPEHFGHVAGKRNPKLSVSGKLVNEPYADGRFSLQVGDILTIHGITTEKVNYTKDGKDSTFIAVSAPSLSPYEKDGEKKYPPIFKGLVSTYEKDGEQKRTDYDQVIHAMVVSERGKMIKPTLETQMEAAAAQKDANGAGKEAPTKETQR